jgi:hypothetical protein
MSIEDREYVEAELMRDFIHDRRRLCGRHV